MVLGFHVKDGFYVKRNEDKSVTLTQMISAKSDETVCDFEITITDNEWASVIASVSNKGEKNNRYYEALAWHND